MSCDIEKCFESKTEIRHNNLSDNLKVNVRRFRYKSDEKLLDNKAIQIDHESNKKFNQDIKIERINDSDSLFRMARKKNCTNNNKKQSAELTNHSHEFCDSNDSINEQQQYNCHYHHHFHNNNESTKSNHSNNSFKENSDCSNHHQHNLSQASSMKNGTNFEHCQHSDEDDEDNIEEIEDDGSAFSDESDQSDQESTDQSSTTSSTSTLHNLHNLRTGSNNDEDNKSDKGGNCCNCCYCEVFGHGLPTKAPTSRNFDEIRDRLRTRLKHKKSEHRSTGDELQTDHHHNSPAIMQNSKKNSHQLNVNQIKSNELNMKRDERDLDELLRFINETENENSKCEKKTKKKKDKKKKKNKTDQTNEKNEDKISFQTMKINCDKEQSTKSNSSDEKNDRHNLSSSAKFNNKSNSINGGQVENCNSKRLKNERILKDEKYDFASDQVSSNGDKSSAFKSNKKQSSNKKSTTKVEKKVKQSDNSSTYHNGQHHQRANEKSAYKKSTNNKDSLLDDVFLPKDIDYEDGSIVDEFEKELEEFKRFCFNSFAVPLPNKEKVNLDLKNIVIKKKPASNSTTSNFSRKNQPV